MTDDAGYDSEGNTRTAFRCANNLQDFHWFVAESVSIDTVHVTVRSSLRGEASKELLDTTSSAASTFKISRTE